MKSPRLATQNVPIESRDMVVSRVGSEPTTLGLKDRPRNYVVYFLLMNSACKFALYGIWISHFLSSISPCRQKGTVWSGAVSLYEYVVAQTSSR